MSGSDVFSTFIQSSDIAAADPDGICTSQTTSGAANLTIAGALATAGVATLVPARNVSITSGGSDERTKTFTITGTDVSGNTVSEEIAGPNTSATVSTTSIFLTVTQVAVDGALAGNVTVGSGATVSATIFAGRARIRGIYFVNSNNAGPLTFVDGNNGATVMKLLTTGTQNTSDYPDIDTTFNVRIASDATNSTEICKDFSNSQCSFSPEAGDMYIFPALQHHMVWPYRSEDPNDTRISLSFNADFTTKSSLDKTQKDQEKMYEEMKKMKESENDKSADVSDINKSG